MSNGDRASYAHACLRPDSASIVVSQHFYNSFITQGTRGGKKSSVLPGQLIARLGFAILADSMPSEGPEYVGWSLSSFFGYWSPFSCFWGDTVSAMNTRKYVSSSSRPRGKPLSSRYRAHYPQRPPPCRFTGAVFSPPGAGPGQESLVQFRAYLPSLSLCSAVPPPL